MKHCQTEKGCSFAAGGLSEPDSASTTAVEFACFGQQHFAERLSDRPVASQH